MMKRYFLNKVISFQITKEFLLEGATINQQEGVTLVLS